MCGPADREYLTEKALTLETCDVWMWVVSWWRQEGADTHRSTGFKQALQLNENSNFFHFRGAAAKVVKISVYEWRPEVSYGHASIWRFAVKWAHSNATNGVSGFSLVKANLCHFLQNLADKTPQKTAIFDRIDLRENRKSKMEEASVVLTGYIQPRLSKTAAQKKENAFITFWVNRANFIFSLATKLTNFRTDLSL